MKRLMVAACAALSMMAAHAQPSDYPAKPIRFVNISSPGSGGDAIARLLAEKMAPIIKGTFFIDNRPGAGGAIAADVVAKAAPDGYTILFGGFTSQVLLATVRTNLSYDPVKDFDPVGQIGTASILLVASKDFPANTLKELIEMAKKSPEPLQYGSWGVGSTGHFCGELLNQRAGIKMTHVPYKGVSGLQNDLLGGQIKLGLIDMASGSPLVKNGSVKALASCTTRSPSLPDVPGFEEFGIDFAGKSGTAPMWAVYAPAHTPKPILDKLSAALKQVVETPEMKAQLLNFGIKVDFVSGEKYREMLANGIRDWRDVAKKSQIVIE